MRQITIFAILCVGLVAVLAIPTPEQVSIPKISVRGKHEITNTLQSLDLIDFSTQDYMADIIYAILKITAGQFLTSIDTATKNLKDEIDQGMIELHQLMHRLDSNTQLRIQEVINKALDEALSNSIQPILSDLGLVLPSITRTAFNRSVSDIIYILLSITFEDFLNKIATSLEGTSQILTNTMGELTRIANTIPDSVGTDLRRISDTRLDRGRSIIRPVLTDLIKVLPAKVSRDVLADVISESVGFDVVTTAEKLDRALDLVETTMTKFVEQINDILSNSQTTIRKKVNQILKESIHEVESTIQPIIKVFLHFVPTSDDIQDREDYKDIISTLLGVSLEDFIFYVDFAIPRIQQIYNQAVIDIRNSCISTHPYLLRQILQLIEVTMEKLENAVDPFITQISPILGGESDRRWVSVEEFVEITKDEHSSEEKVFCNFSMSSGYNKDLIIHLISKVFGFNVTDAALAMINSLSQVDNLYQESGNQLNELISDLHPFVVAEVNRILSNSVNMTRRVMQPAVGVFIQFIPTQGRHDKDVVAGIIHALEELKYDHFKDYIQNATENSAEMASTTVDHIHQIVESGKLHKNNGQSLNDPLLEQVDAIMLQTLIATQRIAQPFFNLIAPVFEP